MSDENYYVNNYLQIVVEVQRTGASVDISSASTKRIYYKKPVSKTVGYWTATASGTHQLVYNATATNGIFDINEAGTWLLYAYVVYADGSTYKGDTCYLEVKKEWEIP